MAHGLAAIPHHYGDNKQTCEEKHGSVLRWSKCSLFDVLLRNCCDADITPLQLSHCTQSIFTVLKGTPYRMLDLRVMAYSLYVMRIFTKTTKPDLTFVNLRADMKEN
jgi:hypothetical protein